MEKCLVVSVFSVEVVNVLLAGLLLEARIRLCVLRFWMLSRLWGGCDLWAFAIVQPSRSPKTSLSRDVRMRGEDNDFNQSVLGNDSKIGPLRMKEKNIRPWCPPAISMTNHGFDVSLQFSELR